MNPKGEKAGFREQFLWEELIWSVLFSVLSMRNLVVTIIASLFGQGIRYGNTRSELPTAIGMVA